MEGQNESVMFEIGVMEHPETSARLNQLAASVIETQRKMMMGVESFGDAAVGVKNSVTGLSQTMNAMEASTLGTIANIEAAIRELRTITAEKLVQTVEVVIQQAGQQSGTPEQIQALQSEANRARDAVEELRSEATKPIAPVIDLVGLRAAETTAQGTADQIQRLSQSPERSPIADDIFAMFNTATKQLDDLQSSLNELNASATVMPENLASVFNALGDGGEAANQIADQIESALDGSDQVRSATAALRNEWNNRVADQQKAYDKLRASHERAVEDNRNAIERINTQLAQGARGFVQSAKGFAQLGIMSEESGKKMLQGLVSIEAATNILGGIVDVVEMTSKGWRSMRQAVDAATKAKQIQMAMAGPEFAMLRAYQTQLNAETAAATAATAANLALGRSRSAAAGSAASAAGGVASRVAGGAVGAGAASAGAAGAGVGIASAGLVATLAAFGAAAGAVTLVLYELKEAATGQASSEKSLTMTIAKTEVSIAASLLRMTGAFEKMDSTGTRMATSFSSWGDSILGSIPVIGEYAKNLNILGDVARVAASQAGVERGQKRLERAKLESTRDEAMVGAFRNASNTLERSRFDSMSKRLRDGIDLSAMDHNAFAEKKVFDDKMAMRRAMAAESLRASNVSSLASPSPMAGRNKQIDFDTSADQIRSRASVMNVNDKLNAEKTIQAEALRLLAQHEAAAAKAAEDLGRNSEAYKAERKEVLRIEDEIEKSLDIQKRLTSEKTALEVQGQRKLMEGLEAKMKSYSDEIQRLKGDYQGSALSFARMDEVQQQFAKDAIVQARNKGATSLTEQQRELLRSVGSEESVRFANEADMAEAKSRGFDQTFGFGTQGAVANLEAERGRIQAQIESAYDVSVNVRLDEAKVVKAIVDEAQSLLDKKAAAIVKTVQDELRAETSKIKQQFHLDLREMKAVRERR
jgi:hypothetical protein